MKMEKELDKKNEDEMQTEITQDENLPEKAGYSEVAKQDGSLSFSGGDMLQVVAKAASNPEVDADKMQKLLDVQERLMAKQAEMNFNQALTTLEGEMPRVVKTGQIVIKGRLQSKYGKYEDLDRIIRPIMRKYGLSLRFNSRQDEKGLTMKGILAHRDGHSESAEVWLPYDRSGNKNETQAVGSTISYGKRYLAGMLLDVVFEGEDDDAQSAGGEKISEDEARDLGLMLKEVKADKARFCKFMDVENLSDIPRKDLEKATKAINKKRRETEAREAKKESAEDE